MANTYLNRTPSSSGSNTTWTYSCWYKKTSVGLDSVPWATGYTSPQIDESMINIGADDQLRFNIAINDATDVTVKSSRKLRDVSAWYHIVVACDTTQGTASNRIKFYINGEQETSFTNSDYPTQGQSTFFGDTNKTQLIGRQPRSSNYLEGNMSHVAFVDGAALAPTVFGETDTASGIWKWKEITGVTWGTNGFHLKFENSGNLGLDSSGNSNTFTVNGSATRTIDNPSIGYATINPLDYSPNPATLQNGNTSYNKSSTGSGHNASMTGTLGAMTGKWYYEFKPTNTSSFIAGMIRTNHGLPNGEGYYGTDAGSYSITNSGKIVGGSESSVSYSYSANDIFGMAYDFDNGKFYVHVNGTYLTSGDPTSGSTGTGSLGDIALGSNIYVPFVSNANYGQTNLMHFNFGNGYFGTTAITSAGSNGNGSLFEYDVPSGYYAINTKNINTYG